MQLIFSAPHPDPTSAVLDVTGSTPVVFGRQTADSIRFSMPGASVERHEKVIVGLLDYDPRATIRTTRAIYHGRDDYRRQKGLDSPGAA